MSSIVRIGIVYRFKVGFKLLVIEVVFINWMFSIMFLFGCLKLNDVVILEMNRFDLCGSQ